MTCCNENASGPKRADPNRTKYRYDALNRRVEKYVPGGPVSTDATTRFIYDGWKIIEERTTVAGSQMEKVRARYGYGTSLSEVLWMDRDAPRVSGTGALDPVTGVTNDTIELRTYLHADALGSVIAVSDKQRSGGNIAGIESFDYSAYGRRTTHTGAWACSGTSCSYTTSVQDGPSLASLSIGYTGHYWDRETGLWYARNRYYDDRQGRFVARDPLGLQGGSHLYSYASGSPLTRIDPLGLMDWSGHEEADFNGGAVAGAPSWLIEEMHATNRGMDTNPNFTAWLEGVGPPIGFNGVGDYELKWVNNGEYHGFGVTVTESDFADALARVVGDPDAGGKLNHLVQDDGIREKGVHGGFAPGWGHFIPDIFRLPLGLLSKDTPNDAQRSAALPASAAVFRAVMSGLSRPQLYRFIARDDGGYKGRAHEETFGYADMIEINSRERLQDTFAAYDSLLARGWITADTWRTGHIRAMDELQWLSRLQSDNSGSTSSRFSPRLFDGRQVQGQRSMGGETAMSVGGVSAADPLTGGRANPNRKSWSSTKANEYDQAQ